MNSNMNETFKIFKILWQICGLGIVIDSFYRGIHLSNEQLLMMGFIVAIISIFNHE